MHKPSHHDKVKDQESRIELLLLLLLFLLLRVIIINFCKTSFLGQDSPLIYHMVKDKMAHAVAEETILPACMDGAYNISQEMC
jgi:hypothetical protein